jgi:transcriptional regulator of arginine metabolism
LIIFANFNNLHHIKNQKDMHPMTSNKILRQSKVKEIITIQEIGSQEELTQLLRDNGFDTTQATLSRDLHELGIVRIPSENGFKYVFHKDQMEQTLKPLMAMEIINVFHNESTIIVKTMPARAQGVAIYFDRWKDSHIIGTVAGDDTIIIVPDKHENIELIMNQIHDLMK